MQKPGRRFDSLLAWYFVAVWGSGFIATKVGLQYAAPFTFLTLRYSFGLACLIPLVLVLRPRWPSSRAELAHILVAGLLMHAVNLGGSHYAQYLGMSAGVTALILAAQPLLTALVASRSLYQRVFCPRADLYSGALLQFAISLAVLAPLAWTVEGMHVRWAWQLFAAIAFLVILASILGVNVLHTLMRHGEAARVTSLMYLTPVFAVVLELLMFGVVPTPLSLVGMAVTCLGVAMVAWQRRRPAAD